MPVHEELQALDDERERREARDESTSELPSKRTTALARRFVDDAPWPCVLRRRAQGLRLVPTPGRGRSPGYINLDNGYSGVTVFLRGDAAPHDCPSVEAAIELLVKHG